LVSHQRYRGAGAAYHAGQISFAELDASIQGWIAHVGHADSWGCAAMSSCRASARDRGAADAA
jgi:hypothetical protein